MRECGKYVKMRDFPNEIARRLERIKTFESNLGRVPCTHYLMSIHTLLVQLPDRGPTFCEKCIVV